MYVWSCKTEVTLSFQLKYNAQDLWASWKAERNKITERGNISWTCCCLIDALPIAPMRNRLTQSEGSWSFQLICPNCLDQKQHRNGVSRSFQTPTEFPGWNARRTAVLGTCHGERRPLTSDNTSTRIGYLNTGISSCSSNFVFYQIPLNYSISYVTECVRILIQAGQSWVLRVNCAR